MEFLFAITWNAAARLLFKNGERALAAYTAGGGAAGHIWDMVGSCSTANGESVSAWECSQSVLALAFSTGFAILHRYVTGLWWKRDSEGNMIGSDIENILQPINNDPNVHDIYIDEEHFGNLGINLSGIHKRSLETKFKINYHRDKNTESWPLRFTLSPRNVKNPALIQSATNFTHGIIFPLVQRNITKRDGINGYEEPFGELFLQSMSEGTVANWNDVQNWEEGNDQQEVWHEWDIMLLIHNLRMGSSIKGMCMWSHSSTNTIYRLLRGISQASD